MTSSRADIGECVRATLGGCTGRRAPVLFGQAVLTILAIMVLRPSFAMHRDEDLLSPRLHLGKIVGIVALTTGLTLYGPALGL